MNPSNARSMKPRSHPLAAAIVMTLLVGVSASDAFAQTTVQAPTPIQPQEQPQTEKKPVKVTLGTQGEEAPRTVGTDERSGDRALQPDRRAEIAVSPGEPVRTVQRRSIPLPGGGLVWVTEDPTLGQQQMSISTTGYVPFENGQIQSPVRFTGYTNYSPFIESAQILVFRSADLDLVDPIATVDVKVGPMLEATWDGQWSDSTNARIGDELMYVVRAKDDKGNVDETYPQRIRLMSQAEVTRGNAIVQTESQRLSSIALNVDAQQARQIERTYGQDALRQRNIRIRGSRVRIHGRNIPDGYSLTINGANIPVDLERKFASEYLEPIGVHGYDVRLTGHGGVRNYRLGVDVTGNHFFAVGLADVTLSKSHGTRSVTPTVQAADNDDLISEGRLAFYLKGKYQGKYLLTAQADTRERQLRNLFDGFFKADPQDVFRRLDPDLYYPTTGDDSTTYRDVDTMGRLYARVDWDGNQALWGNYATGMTGTEYAQYDRSLYGAALSWRSPVSTSLGEPRTLIRAFASDAQTLPGHNEFLGTGGSLYYLRNTDILPGSDQLVVESRDPVTGRVVSRTELVRGADYDIDELQGRVILNEPLVANRRDAGPGIGSNTPLQGYTQILLVDYEYLPRGFKVDETLAGIRAKHWLNDQFAVGGTIVRENRTGEDHELTGADVTWQPHRGTYIKVERSNSKATAMSGFGSDNGGLSFEPLQTQAPGREGDAMAIDARVNLREVGVTRNDWSLGAWHRKVDPGYSVSRFDYGQFIQEQGVEVLGQITQQLSLYGMYSDAERGGAHLKQGQLTTEWRMDEKRTLAAELRSVTEQWAGMDGQGLLGAVQYRHRVSPTWEYWLTGQTTLDDDGGNYADNDALTVGTRLQFGELSSLNAEYVTGDRGDALQVGGEYRFSTTHSWYANYTYSSDTTLPDSPFRPTLRDGWTVGQRWRLSNTVNVFNESQFLKDPNESGLSHTFGLDFYPSLGWNFGIKLNKATLDKPSGEVDRRAISLSGGHTTPRTQWQSKLEWREDRGIEQRTQWVTTNTLHRKFNEDLRLAARFNYSETTDDLDPTASARFTEGNLGLAWRPHDNTRYALFARYTYLYDVSALPQLGDNVAFYDQKTQVISVEGIYHPFTRWEFAGKLARRTGEVRYGRMEGDWAKADTTFAAAQVRWGIGDTDWNALGEYRWLSVRPDAGRRSGWLVALDRDITRYLRVGVGYNFSDYSDDLTNQSYDHKGWFLNLTGRY